MHPIWRMYRIRRICSDVFLLLCTLIMVLWPWVFFAIVKEKGGIQMNGRLGDVYDEHPHEVAIVVTLLGTVNRLIATFLLDREMTVFGVSTLVAFRHASLVWKSRQWRGLAMNRSRFVIFLMLLSYLAGLTLIPSGTAGLITPGEFKKGAELRGTELDFGSDDPGCMAWLEENRVQTNCDWRIFRGVSFTTCLGGNQMLDALDSGRANILSKVIGIQNGTSSWGQLDPEHAIRFLGSAKGILPIGPNGARAFNTLHSSLDPFEDEYTRTRMVSYNYTLIQQGIESNVSCAYDTASPIRYQAIQTTSTAVIGTTASGSCDPAVGLEDVLENAAEYPTLSVNNTLAYWACKQRPLPGALDPTYFIYLRGQANYATSIGNITCTVSPVGPRTFSVDYLSLPGYFVTKPATTLAPQPPQTIFARYIQHGLIGLGNLIWEGQNWSSNLVPETVLSIAVKNLNLSTLQPNPRYLELYEAMLQGILEYEATYSRLIYSVGVDPPGTCLRNITGSVSYSVRGWFISDSFTQAGLLLPMTLINLATFSLLIVCFVMGKFRFMYNFDATDTASLLAARVAENHWEDEVIDWTDKVLYRSMNHVRTHVPTDGAFRGTFVDGELPP